MYCSIALYAQYGYSMYTAVRTGCCIRRTTSVTNNCCCVLFEVYNMTLFCLLYSVLYTRYTVLLYYSTWYSIFCGFWILDIFRFSAARAEVSSSINFPPPPPTLTRREKEKWKRERERASMQRVDGGGGGARLQHNSSSSAQQQQRAAAAEQRSAPAGGQNTGTIDWLIVQTSSQTNMQTTLRRNTLTTLQF